MRRTHTFGLAGVAAIAALAISAGTTQALQIAQEQHFGTGASFNTDVNFTGNSVTGNFVNGSLNDSTDLAFNQFDSALGTLNSVQVEIFNILVFGNVSATFRDNGALQLTAGRASLGAILIDFDFQIGAAFLRGRGGEFDTCSDGPSGAAPFGGASCTAGTSYTSALTSINEILPGSILANFIGASTVTMTIDQIGTASFAETDGDDGYIDSRSASLQTIGAVRLTYDYTVAVTEPVPVPATLGLLGLGLAGLGVAARRRTR